MRTLNRRRLDWFAWRYPDDPCRQIACYVLDCPERTPDDHHCATRLLNALEAAEHAHDLAIVEVTGEQLRAAAMADAELLWNRYGDR